MPNIIQAASLESERDSKGRSRVYWVTDRQTKERLSERLLSLDEYRRERRRVEARGIETALEAAWEFV